MLLASAPFAVFLLNPATHTTFHHLYATSLLSQKYDTVEGLSQTLDRLAEQLTKMLAGA
jgi:hypothetical protein